MAALVEAVAVAASADRTKVWVEIAMDCEGAIVAVCVQILRPRNDAAEILARKAEK